MSTGKWRLNEGVWVEEPDRSINSKEIEKFRKDKIILSTVMLSPLEEGEVVTLPPAGLVTVYKNMFKHGYTLSLPGCVQYILCALGLAPGQIRPNAWRKFLGMYVFTPFRHGWPMYNEVLTCYKVMYSMKNGCSGTVNLHSRAFGAIVVDLPT